jgi:glycosyltransferase involved in cell wall biosynthesis
MPVFNGMPYIHEAVESVLAQDEQDWELVISDNGSTDSTRDYLNTLQDPRILIHLQQDNLGIFGNLNFLLEQAQASVAKILCADDKLLPGALARIATFMEERPWCAVSRCWRLGDEQRSVAGEAGVSESALPVSMNPKAALLACLTFGNPVGNLSQATCRPAMVIGCGGFNQSLPYSGDREAWARISSAYGLELQNEELIFERVHAQQSRILLDKNNENLAQIDKIIEGWAAMVNDSDLVLLKRHWIIHFIAQRLPKLVRKAMAGEFVLARSGLANLPLGISPIAVIAYYPVVKFNLPLAFITTQQLLARILEENESHS